MAAIRPGALGGPGGAIGERFLSAGMGWRDRRHPRVLAGVYRPAFEALKPPGVSIKT